MLAKTSLLNKHGCLDWDTLVLGLRRDLCTRRDLIEFAVDELVRGITYKGYEHALLAGAEAYLADGFDGILAAFLEKNGLSQMGPVAKQKALQRWWLASLALLAERRLSDEDTLDQVDSLWGCSFIFDDYQGFRHCGCASYMITYGNKANCAAVGEGPCNLRAVKQAASALQQLSLSDP